MINFRFSKRETLLFVITISIAGCVGIVFFAVEPLINKLSSLDASIRKKSYLLQQQSYFVQRGDSIESLYQHYQDILKKFSSNEEITEYFFEAVKRLAKERGLAVRQVKPLAAVRQKTFQQISLELEFEGDFKSLFQLINDLENSPALLNIGSMTIRSAMRDGKRLQCRLSLSKIFF